MSRFWWLAPVALIAACSEQTPSVVDDAGTEKDVVTVTDTGPMSCPTGQIQCGALCVDTAADNTNCGACGTVCATGQSCNAGVCAAPPECPTGEARCGTACVNTSADLANCGSCGNACATGQTCTGGSCTTPVTCPTGQTSCGGVCVDTQTDATNCGACGTACTAGQSCTAGACVATTTCTAPQVACGGTCVDPQTDLNNCGACGTVCASGQACTAGVCGTGACPTGQTRCGTACVDTNTDVANCMSCGRACATGQTCVAGACTGGVTCPTGQSTCGTGASAVCADLTTDPANCGACGTACAAGQTCTGSRCGSARPTCTTGQTDCTPSAAAPTCVDTTSSNANCGACGNACPTGQTCAGSTCTCAAGQRLCGRTCVNVQTDRANCGACGNACPTGQTCAAGVCGCPSGQRLCSGACVNTATDETNCGACGTACAAGQTCTASACACPTGQTGCGTPVTCTTTATDRANCGACGRVCAAGQTCTAGVCACPTGQITCGTPATCVNPQTNAANCGRCGVACAAGTACTAGVCRGTPPANDTRAGATLINLTAPAQTIATDTTLATNNTTGTCGCTSGNDVYFRFVLTAPEYVYADTLGATWDTSLFLQSSTGTNLTAPTGAVACNDDAGSAALCPGLGGLQSQIAMRLAAGTYYLVLSGCSAGTAMIKFQHLPAGNGAAARITPSGTVQTAMGTTSGTGTVTSTCCSGGADNSYWWLTCPGTAAATTFYASTCSATTGASTTAFDVEVSQSSALRTVAAVCNDDAGFVCGIGSSMSSTIPATAANVVGLNTLVVDSCSGAGAYTVSYVLANCASGSRCGATCANTATDVNHCGGCDRRCAAGNVCAAGVCVPPPANDTPAGAVTINMAVPQSTFTADTRAAVNNTSGSCGCTTGSDVFYNFTIPAGPSQIVYADTFGSNYDTSLFVQTSAGTNVTATNLPANGIACNDDNGLAGCNTGTQSQIMLRLNPGAYRLVVSGCGNGTLNLRFQHLPVGNGAVAALAAGSSTPGGVVAGTGLVTGSCNSGGPENTYYWFTCAAARSGTFTASTCGRATWDTSVHQSSANRTTPGVNVCNDDVGGTCGVRSSITSTIPAGPGLHTFYVDAFSSTAGAYTVSVSRP